MIKFWTTQQIWMMIYVLKYAISDKSCGYHTIWTNTNSRQSSTPIPVTDERGYYNYITPKCAIHNNYYSEQLKIIPYTNNRFRYYKTLKNDETENSDCRDHNYSAYLETNGDNFKQNIKLNNYNNKQVQSPFNVIYLIGYDEDFFKIKEVINRCSYTNLIIIHFYLYKNSEYSYFGKALIDAEIFKLVLNKYSNFYCLNSSMSGNHDNIIVIPRKIYENYADQCLINSDNIAEEVSLDPNNLGRKLGSYANIFGYTNLPNKTEEKNLIYYTNNENSLNLMPYKNMNREVLRPNNIQLNKKYDSRIDYLSTAKNSHLRSRQPNFIKGGKINMYGEPIQYFNDIKTFVAEKCNSLINKAGKNIFNIKKNQRQIQNLPGNAINKLVKNHYRPWFRQMPRQNMNAQTASIISSKPCVLNDQVETEEVPNQSYLDNAPRYKEIILPEGYQSQPCNSVSGMFTGKLEATLVTEDRQSIYPNRFPTDNQFFISNLNSYIYLNNPISSALLETPNQFYTPIKTRYQAPTIEPVISTSQYTLIQPNNQKFSLPGQINESFNSPTNLKHLPQYTGRYVTKEITKRFEPLKTLATFDTNSETYHNTNNLPIIDMPNNNPKISYSKEIYVLPKQYVEAKVTPELEKSPFSPCGKDTFTLNSRIKSYIPSKYGFLNKTPVTFQENVVQDVSNQPGVTHTPPIIKWPQLNSQKQSLSNNKKKTYHLSTDLNHIQSINPISLFSPNSTSLTSQSLSTKSSVPLRLIDKSTSFVEPNLQLHAQISLKQPSARVNPPLDKGLPDHTLNRESVPGSLSEKIHKPWDSTFDSPTEKFTEEMKSIPTSSSLYSLPQNQIYTNPIRKASFELPNPLVISNLLNTPLLNDIQSSTEVPFMKTDTKYDKLMENIQAHPGQTPIFISTSVKGSQIIPKQIKPSEPIPIEQATFWNNVSQESLYKMPCKYLADRAVNNINEYKNPTLFQPLYKNSIYEFNPYSTDKDVPIPNKQCKLNDHPIFEPLLQDQYYGNVHEKLLPFLLKIYHRQDFKHLSKKIHLGYNIPLNAPNQCQYLPLYQTHDKSQLQVSPLLMPASTEDLSPKLYSHHDIYESPYQAHKYIQPSSSNSGLNNLKNEEYSKLPKIKSYKFQLNKDTPLLQKYTPYSKKPLSEIAKTSHYYETTLIPLTTKYLPQRHSDLLPSIISHIQQFLEFTTPMQASTLVKTLKNIPSFELETKSLEQSKVNPYYSISPAFNVGVSAPLVNSIKKSSIKQHTSKRLKPLSFISDKDKRKGRPKYDFWPLIKSPTLQSQSLLTKPCFLSAVAPQESLSPSVPYITYYSSILPTTNKPSRTNQKELQQPILQQKPSLYSSQYNAISPLSTNSNQIHDILSQPTEKLNPLSLKVSNEAGIYEMINDLSYEKRLSKLNRIRELPIKSDIIYSPKSSSNIIHDTSTSYSPQSTDPSTKTFGKTTTLKDALNFKNILLENKQNYQYSGPYQNEINVNTILKGYTPDTELKSIKMAGKNINLPLLQSKMNACPQNSNTIYEVIKNLISNYSSASLDNKIYENTNYKTDKITIPLGELALAKYEPINSHEFLIKTAKPDILLKAWSSRLKLIRPKLVFDVKEYEALNFIPVVNKNYCTPEVAQSIAKAVVTELYREPIVINGIYSMYKAYAIVNNINYNLVNDDRAYILWPTLCNCGCMMSGCRCSA